jgi:multicomponent Na+:H+ antiporter subunit A
VTEQFQHGDLRRYLVMVVVGFGTLIAWSMIMAGAVPVLPAIGPIRPAETMVALVGLGGAIAATRSKTLLAAMVATGLAGFAVAITFMMNGAPDLALTQFTVEALLVVLLTALLLAVPLASPITRTGAMRRADAVIAIILGGLLSLGILDMAAGPHQSAAADFYGRMSYLAAHGHNVVNVILVDFRAFDTLGETTVIAIAAALAGSLLADRDPHKAAATPKVHFTFRIAARPLAWLLFTASLVILWRGHNQPGGGFVGGLVAALSFALIALAYGVGRAERALKVRPLTLTAIGLTAALVSGLPGMAGGKPYLTHLWWEPGGMLPALGTTMIFDLGVYLVVLGAVLAFLFGLSREAER